MPAAFPDGGPLLLGVDIGTLRTKGVLVSLDGRVLATHGADHPVHGPRPGWAEHDALRDWWGGFRQVVRALLTVSPDIAQRVAGVGISGLFPCLCLVDAQGEPLHRAILYSDRRADGELDEASDLVGAPLRADSVTPKLLWLRKHRPNLLRQARRLFNSYDYVTFRLTGGRALDHKTAWAFGGLFDGRTATWRQDALARLGLSAGIVPRVRQPFDVIGPVTPAAAGETELRAGTSVIVGAADTIASLLGAGVIRRGDAMVYYGGTGTLDACTLDFADALTRSELVGKDVPYALGTYSLAAGAALRWFRDQFGTEERRLAEKLGREAYQVLDGRAVRVPAGSDGLIILPSFRGETWPNADADARASLFGLTLGHTRAHIYRALLESYGYELRRGLRYLERRNIPVERLVAVGGGARSGLWRQIVSDITGIPQRYVERAGAPLGVAFLAGYGLGLCQKVTDIESWLPAETMTEPRIELSARYSRCFERYLSLREAIRAIHAPPDGQAPVGR